MLNYANDGSNVRLPDQVAVPSEVEFASMASTRITLAKRIRILFGLALAESGYHNGQDQLLTCLIPGESCAVSALAAMVDVRPSTISKMLDRLAEKGLIERRPDDTDRRVTLVCLTASGVEARTNIWNLWAEVCRQVAPGLPGELSAIMRQLGNVSDVLGARLMRVR